jgi:hypothetical protein
MKIGGVGNRSLRPYAKKTASYRRRHKIVGIGVGRQELKDPTNSPRATLPEYRNAWSVLENPRAPQRDPPLSI